MKRIILALLILIGFTAYSQDTTFIYSKNWKHSGMGSIAYTYLNVNDVEQHIINTVLFHDNSYKHFDISNQIKYTALIKSGSPVTNDVIYRLQPRLVYKKFTVFNYTQLSYLWSRRVNYRIEEGIGAGMFIYKGSKFKATLSDAVLYTKTEYNKDSTINREFIRSSTRLQLMGELSNIKYFIEMYYQPALGDISNYNYSYNAKLSYMMDKKVSLNIALVKSYESYAFANTKNINTNFSVGIGYTY